MLRKGLYIYGGAIIGTLAPIVGVRYLFLPKTENALHELAMWGCSLLINASPMIVKPHIPIPLYGFAVGT